MMLEAEYLVYEQDEVQLLGESDNPSYFGKLRIVEKGGDPAIEWSPNLGDPADNEWAVITPPSVTFSSQKIQDSIVINNGKKVPQKIFLFVNQIHFCKIFNRSRNLELLKKDKEVIASLFFHSENADYFFDVLQRYITVRPQEHDSTLFLLQNKKMGNIDDQLSALNLVPTYKPNKKRSKSPLNGAGYLPPWSDTQKRVWGFFRNMREDPYTTTLTTLCKVYDVVLYGGEEERDPGKEDEEMANLLKYQISGFDDLEPGYEILTKLGQLADRPEVERLSPLTHDEFKTFVNQNGQVEHVDALKERIFKGGLHSSLRCDLWCYLLDCYDWNSTTLERDETRHLLEQKYFVMKHQWKTISEEQERNFSGFRERRSIIEKDVNRTDRNHPFYEGDENPNLEVLHDILMTYVMYNFDLGYVQGMSDLLAPMLYIIKNEPTAFWCFVGFMNRVHRNFDLDQSGMKQQLSDLAQLLRVIDPEFMSFLEAQDCANFYFCFRWLLVRFKRELNYSDTLRLWEVLWTGFPCKNFHLCIAVAILDSEKQVIIERKCGFSEILKHVNGLSMNIDLDMILRKAEAIYRQLEATTTIPNNVREILDLPLATAEDKVLSRSTTPGESKSFLPGHAERISPPSNDEEVTSPSQLESSTPLLSQQIPAPEKSYEKSSLHSNFS